MKLFDAVGDKGAITDFRAIKGAVSLKLDYPATDGVVTIAEFPRHQRRGLIEASSASALPSNPARYFRAIKGAVSLKRRRFQSHHRTNRLDFRAIKGAVLFKQIGSHRLGVVRMMKP